MAFCWLFCLLWQTHFNQYLSPFRAFYFACRFDALDASVSAINALKVFLQDGLHRWMGQDQFTQVTHVGLAPIGLALVAEAVAQETSTNFSDWISIATTPPRLLSSIETLAIICAFTDRVPA